MNLIEEVFIVRVQEQKRIKQIKRQMQVKYNSFKEGPLYKTNN